MKNFICVYDYETDGKLPYECEPTELGACIISPRTLEIVENSEFILTLRPPQIDEPDYYRKHEDTIGFHAKNRLKEGENIEDKKKQIFESWKAGVDQKIGWQQFIAYLEKYNINKKKKSMFGAPIRAGSNIRGFDDIISTRLANRYGQVNKEKEMNIFHPRDVIDTQDLAFYWFESLKEPTSYSMDSLRPFFGMSKEGGHAALKDVKDSAWVICKMLKLHRSLASRIGFKGSYKNG